MQLQLRQRAAFGLNAACTFSRPSASRRSRPALSSQITGQALLDNRGETMPPSRERRPLVTYFIVAVMRKQSIDFFSLRAKILKGRRELHALSGCKKPPCRLLAGTPHLHCSLVALVCAAKAELDDTQPGNICI